jgi:hypothetical protein
MAKSAKRETAPRKKAGAMGLGSKKATTTAAARKARGSREPRAVAAKGKPGADSSSLVTTQFGSKNLLELAKDLFGEYPVFWGRYFGGASGPTGAEYLHRREDGVLHAAGVKVLPIAQQTPRVSGNENQGSADAKANAEDVIGSFGAAYLKTLGNEFLVFLDVEGTRFSVLSEAYYTGWANGLVSTSQALTGGDITLRPAIYAPRGNTPTWTAAANCVAHGVPCDGAWVAKWFHKVPSCTPVPDWDNALVTPAVALPFPILAWQYDPECHGGNGFDMNQLNPNLDPELLLSRLILPPDESGT